jgi:hypothetical protein
MTRPVVPSCWVISPLYPCPGVVSFADAALWSHTVAACTSADASVTHKHALKICKPSCVPRTTKPFFIPMVHSSPGAVRHMAAPELPSQEGKARSHGTCGSTRAHLIKEARSRVEGYVAAPELTSARRQGPGPRDTWWRWSPPLQGGEVWGRRTRGNIGAHLPKEARSGAEGYMTVPELASARRRRPRPRDMWWHQSPPLQGGVVRSYSLCGSVLMHVLLLVLT